METLTGQTYEGEGSGGVGGVSLRLRPAICLNTVYMTLCQLEFPDSMVVLVYPWKETL